MEFFPNFTEPSPLKTGTNPTSNDPLIVRVDPDWISNPPSPSILIDNVEGTVIFDDIVWSVFTTNVVGLLPILDKVLAKSSEEFAIESNVIPSPAAPTADANSCLRTVLLLVFMKLFLVVTQFRIDYFYLNYPISTQIVGKEIHNYDSLLHIPFPLTPSLLASLYQVAPVF